LTAREVRELKELPRQRKPEWRRPGHQEEPEEAPAMPRPQKAALPADDDWES
jgi:hypothetical protein